MADSHPALCSSSGTSPSRSARSSPSARAACASKPARSTRWSGRTVPASRPWSRSSPASTDATRVSSLLGRRERRLRLDRRLQGGGRRGDLPGADALSGPLGHGEHLHGPPAPRPGPPHRPGGDVRRGRGALRPARCRDRPRRPARGLSIADQQIIEIAKAISLDARLHHGRADRRPERCRGRAAVRRRPQPPRRGPRARLHLAPLRRGLRPERHDHRDARRPVRRHPPHRADTTSPAIVAEMVGREVADLFPKTPARIGEPVLEVEGLDRRAASSTTSRFTVRAGEIVGLAGLVGAGRSEIARAVFGVDGYDRAGSAARPRDPTTPASRHRAPAWRSCPRTAGQAGPGH